MSQPKQLPAEPLASLLRERVLRAGSVEKLAEQIEEDDGSIEQWLRATWVYAATADRVCIALGTHPALVWPEEWTAFLDPKPKQPRPRTIREKKHGTRWGYMRGCRCDPCVEANRTYYRERARWVRAQKKAAA